MGRPLEPKLSLSARRKRPHRPSSASVCAIEWPTLSPTIPTVRTVNWFCSALVILLRLRSNRNRRKPTGPGTDTSVRRHEYHAHRLGSAISGSLSGGNKPSSSTRRLAAHPGGGYGSGFGRWSGPDCGRFARRCPPSPRCSAPKRRARAPRRQESPPAVGIRSDPQVRPTTCRNPGAAATSTILGI